MKRRLWIVALALLVTTVLGANAVLVVVSTARPPVLVDRPAPGREAPE